MADDEVTTTEPTELPESLDAVVERRRHRRTGTQRKGPQRALKGQAEASDETAGEPESRELGYDATQKLVGGLFKVAHAMLAAVIDEPALKLSDDQAAKIGKGAAETPRIRERLAAVPGSEYGPFLAAVGEVEAEKLSEYMEAEAHKTAQAKQPRPSTRAEPRTESPVSGFPPGTAPADGATPPYSDPEPSGPPTATGPGGLPGVRLHADPNDPETQQYMASLGIGPQP